jgi:hypothetical protein
MRNWKMPPADATYRPLKAFVASRSNSRLRLHGSLRDRMIEAIVEEWPVGCPPDRVEEVVTARMKIRLREQYGSVVAMFLLSILVNALVKLIIEWWFDRESHRVLMVGWAEQAGKR